MLTLIVLEGAGGAGGGGNMGSGGGGGRFSIEGGGGGKDVWLPGPFQNKPKITFRRTPNKS